MATDRFFIGPYDSESGRQTNLKPWAIPDTAFSTLENAYVFRGRVRKRFGSIPLGSTVLQSRLRVAVGTITGGALSGNVRSILNNPSMSTAVGQAFSVYDSTLNTFVLFTIYNGTPGPQQMYRTDGSSATATFDLTTSAFNITGVTTYAGGDTVYFYPALPVMGLLSYDTPNIEDEFIIGFDTEFAYQFSNGWERLAAASPTAADYWTGSNSQFFWGTTWTGTDPSFKVFFVTNFNQNEAQFMRYYTGTGGWSSFNPPIVSNDTLYLNSARILIPFKNRLLAFNTWEGPPNSGPGENFQARVRYSSIGSPLATNAWYQDVPGLGNAIDASTTESIITVENIKDRLIVFFERSTWELAYTGNQAYPFTWQQINTELGAESTFSVVPFDKIAIGVGNVGINSCNGSNVERIDDKIPQEIFDIHNDDEGIFRVYGIRDYYVEMTYWTFPNTLANAQFPYPNRVLVYNYKNDTWGINNDSITCFGYYQSSVNITWQSNTITFSDDYTWGSGQLQSLFRQVVAGNQEGFTFNIAADSPVNAAALQITDIQVNTNIITMTVIDHNLREGEYVYFEGITGTGNLAAELNNNIFKLIDNFVYPVTSTQFSFIYQDDLDTVIAGVYSGGGFITRISKINIKTKEYNFYAEQGRNSYVSKVDFMVDATFGGQVQVDYYVSTATTPLLQDDIQEGVIVGTSNLDTFPYTEANIDLYLGGQGAPIQFERTATRLWHPVYFQADGEIVQFQLTMNDVQMRSQAISASDFQLHALIIHATPSSSRLS